MQILKPLIIPFSPVTCHLCPLNSKYSPTRPVYEHNHFFPLTRDSKFHNQTKLPHSWSGQALGTPGVYVSQNLKTFCTWKWWGYTQPSAFFILRSCLNTHLCERLSRSQDHSAAGKISVTLLGTEPSTFRLVAQCLNICTTAYPHIHTNQQMKLCTLGNLHYCI